MPLTREQKNSVVAEISQLLDSSKIVVLATYSGSGVKDLQALRKSAKETGSQLKIVKNRLFKQALSTSSRLKNIDASPLTGQLIYGFNAQDEAAPAHSLAEFAKINPQVQFIGAITEDAQFLSPEDVQSLASLPSKQQLRAQLAGTLSAPARGLVTVLSGNIRGLMNALNARAEALEQ